MAISCCISSVEGIGGPVLPDVVVVHPEGEPVDYLDEAEEAEADTKANDTANRGCGKKHTFVQ